jgi:uncharacterized caspase-like protein
MSTVFVNGHALVIGISNYQHAQSLPQRVFRDAKDISRYLTSSSYCGYPEEQVEVLLNEQADGSNIRHSLEKLSRSTTSGDTAVIFFSGHGGRIEVGSDKGTYIIPFDCHPGHFRDTSISSEELTIYLSRIKASSLVVLLEGCHSSDLGELNAVEPFADITKGAIDIKSGFDRRTYDDLTKGAGQVAMTSSRSDEVSLILRDMENGHFTHYLHEALRWISTKSTPVM